MLHTVKSKLVIIGAVAILALSGLGVTAFASRAQTGQLQTLTQIQGQSQDCSADQVDGTAEAANAGPDTDAIDLQCGDQTDNGSESADAAGNTPEQVNANDTDTAQNEGQFEDGTPDSVTTGEQDQVQNEQNSEPDDATETPSVEDAPGQ